MKKSKGPSSSKSVAQEPRAGSQYNHSQHKTKTSSKRPNQNPLPSQNTHNQVDAYGHEKDYPSHAGGLSPDQYAEPDYIDGPRDGDVLDRQRRHNDDRRGQSGVTSKKKSIIDQGCDKIKDFFYGDAPYPQEHEPRVDSRFTIPDPGNSKLRVLAEDQSRRIDDLETKLEAEQMKSKQLKESTNQMILRMENKELFIGRQDSDAAVVTQFSGLIDRVATWSIPFAQNEHASTGDLPHIPKEILQRVVPVAVDLGHILRSPKEARLFVRGYVSLAMTEMLIRTLPDGDYLGPPAIDLWMDQPLARAVDIVELYFSASEDPSVNEISTTGGNSNSAVIVVELGISMLMKYRAFTASLISRSKVVNKAGIDQNAYFVKCVNSILDVVGPLAPEDKSEQLATELEGILVQAIRLSQTLRCQRASWSVRHVVPRARSNDLPVHFDGSIMVDVRDDAGDDGDQSYRRLVEFVVSPALFKRGNTDGEHYDIESCMERAKVRPLPPPNPASTGGERLGHTGKQSVRSLQSP